MNDQVDGPEDFTPDPQLEERAEVIATALRNTLDPVDYRSIEVVPSGIYLSPHMHVLVHLDNSEENHIRVSLASEIEGKSGYFMGLDGDDPDVPEYAASLMDLKEKAKAFVIAYQPSDS